MIKTADAIRTGRNLIGTLYGELDCIFYIMEIIRKSPGGVKDYRTATTVTLWDSINMSAKYKDLTWRQEGIEGAKAGMLAFKRYDKPADHVGLVTERGTVLHSSSKYGYVVETPLKRSEGWDSLAVHRYIEVADGAAESEGRDVESYQAKVVLQDTTSTLNVRDMPAKRGNVIGRLKNGEIVTVQTEHAGGWVYATYEGGVGYLSSEYLERVESGEADDLPTGDAKYTSLVREDGVSIMLAGRWKVADD